jgi:hypothetical protein
VDQPRPRRRIFSRGRRGRGRVVITRSNNLLVSTTMPCHF